MFPTYSSYHQPIRQPSYTPMSFYGPSTSQQYYQPQPQMFYPPVQTQPQFYQPQPQFNQQAPMKPANEEEKKLSELTGQPNNEQANEIPPTDGAQNIDPQQVQRLPPDNRSSRMSMQGGHHRLTQSMSQFPSVRAMPIGSSQITYPANPIQSMGFPQPRAMTTSRVVVVQPNQLNSSLYGSSFMPQPMTQSTRMRSSSVSRPLTSSSLQPQSSSLLTSSKLRNYPIKKEPNKFAKLTNDFRSFLNDMFK